MDYTLRDGKKLTVKPASKEDAGALVEYMNIVGGESDNLTFGENECRFTVEEEEAYVEHVSAQKTSTMLLGWVDGVLASTANLSGDSRSRLAHLAELGVSVRKPFWRMGIGEIMMRELIAFARETGILKTILLTVRTDNETGIRLYERLGFERVGVHRNHIQVNGEYFDMLVMELHL